MRMPFKTSSRLATPLMLATTSLSLLALHCSSDGGGPSSSSAGTPSSGAGGTAAQAGTTSGGMTTGGVVSAGTSSGGTPIGGTPTGGTPTGGAMSGGSAGTAGAGGASGAGGATGGAGGGGGAAGSSGSGGGGGGTAVTFTQVKDLLMKSCAGAKCHDAASTEMDWITDTAGDSLYTRLTTPIPQGTPHCVGQTPIVASMPAQSLLLQAVGPTRPMCDGKALARMPDNCSTTSANPRACLTDVQIKLISDWISAGAPK